MENKNYELINENLLQVAIFPTWKNEEQMKHCFTTKHGGVSSGSLESLNLGFNRGDKKENVIENYTRVANYLHTSIDHFVLSNQVHETIIEKVYGDHRGNGICKANIWESCDGLYTTEKGITLVTHYADCVPLFFYSREKGGIIGLAHAGWRGTVEEIGAKMIDLWLNQEGISRESIEVGIGPSIGPCCFEVHDDVAQRFIEKFGDAEFIKPLNSNKFSINLWECNRKSLIKKGVLEHNIYQMNCCTCCQSDTFYSHRKTQGNRGTLGAFMTLI